MTNLCGAPAHAHPRPRPAPTPTRANTETPPRLHPYKHPGKHPDKHPERHLATRCGAPVVMGMLLNAPEARGWAVRAEPRPVQMLTAGAPPPAAVLEAMEALGFQVTHVYGRAALEQNYINTRR